MPNETCETCGRALEWRWKLGSVGYDKSVDACPVCSAVAGKSAEDLASIMRRAAEELRKMDEKRLFRLARDLY